MMADAEKRIEQLESQLAFMEQDVVALRDSVDTHQRQILALERHCDVLTERLRQAIEDAGPATDAGTDERPPHY